MKVLVNYPVMVTPGVYRYENMELDMTVEQVPYAVEDIEHELAMDSDALYICVKSDDAVEKLATMRKDYLEMRVQIELKLLQAHIETWCHAHGIDPKYVTYENGKICIPFKC
jgi:hypothetical protein